MKKFLLKIVLFLALPVIFIEGTILVFQGRIFSEENMDNVFWRVAPGYQWVERVNKAPQILLLGSSSVKYGLSCSVLNKLSADSLAFINLANNARCPVETYFLLKNMNLKNVKAAYLGLDPWIYARRYYKHRNSYLYLDMGFVPSIIYYFQHDKSIFTKRYKQLYSFLTRGEYTKNCKPNKKQKIPPDFGSVALKKQPKNFDMSIKKWFQLREYGWSELQFVYTEKIAKLCRSEGIEFYAFIPPKRSDFTETYLEECQEIHEEFVEKLWDHGFDAKIFGTFSQLDNHGDWDLFQEAFHMNQKGQNLYSKLFFEMMYKRKEKFSPDYPWIDLENY
jgi:hypothetical protein